MAKFVFKATPGLPAVSDNWIADPAVRAVRVYPDDNDGGIVLQMFGAKRYLRATMTSEEARALAQYIMDVADGDKP